MSSQTLQLLGTLGAAALALFGVWLSTRQAGRKANTDAYSGMFDQLQEERNAAEKRHAEDKAEWKDELRQAKEKIEKLESDNRDAYKRELVRDDFIQELRNHIRLEKGPPPPEWPEELRHG